MTWRPDGGNGSEPSPVDVALELVGVLADGMGGHVAGSLASRLVCERFVQSWSEPPADGLGISERLAQALEAANGAVGDVVASNPMLSGMGTTIIGAYFEAAGVHWISVGDSPAFLFRRGEIAQFNADHSLAPELDRMAAAGTITWEQARTDSRRHMLLAAVTGEEIDYVDLAMKPLALEAGDLVLLASDGLQSLEVAEIARIVSAYSQDGAGAVARALIRAVDNSGVAHQDNATVLVVRVLSA